MVLPIILLTITLQTLLLVLVVLIVLALLTYGLRFIDFTPPIRNIIAFLLIVIACLIILNIAGIINI